MNILITGTTRGLGKALAVHYRALGHSVYGINRNCSDEHDYHASVSDPAELQVAFDAMRKADWIPDLVVNNAAIGQLGYLALLRDDRAIEMADANFLGTHFVCRQAARLMREGSIVNISSIFTTTKPAGVSVYAASKAAVETYTVAISRELAPRITVNCLALSPYDSEMLRASGPKEKVQAAIAELPIPRLATVEDVVNVLDFFASPASRFVTGQTIRLGGVA